MYSKEELSSLLCLPTSFSFIEFLWPYFPHSFTLSSATYSFHFIPRVITLRTEHIPFLSLPLLFYSALSLSLLIFLSLSLLIFLSLHHRPSHINILPPHFLLLGYLIGGERMSCLWVIDCLTDYSFLLSHLFSLFCFPSFVPLLTSRHNRIPVKQWVFQESIGRQLWKFLPSIDRSRFQSSISWR